MRLIVTRTSEPGIKCSFKKILDVVTGTGTIALLAAERFPQVEIEAIDLSNGILNQEKKKASEKGLKNIKFRRQDIETIAFTNVKFDIVTCGSSESLHLYVTAIIVGDVSSHQVPQIVQMHLNMGIEKFKYSTLAGDHATKNSRRI